jgi:hypothetical protein
LECEHTEFKDSIRSSGTLLSATTGDELSFDLTVCNRMSYIIYITSDCGGELSAWSNVAVCTTKNTVARAFICDFENVPKEMLGILPMAAGHGITTGISVVL